MRFTITAGVPGHAPRPCAIVEAVSEEAALRQARALREDGTLAFLPVSADLLVRQTSRREAAAYEAFVQRRPGNAPAASGDPATRARRIRQALFEKLWRGELTSPPA